MPDMRLWQHKNGKFYVTFARGDHRSLGTKDPGKAQEAFDLMEKEYLNGRLVRLEKKTMCLLSDFIKEYHESRPEKAHKTKQADKLALNKLKDFYGNKPLAGLTGRKLADFRAHLVRQGIQHSSVNVHVRHTKKAIKTAIQWKYMQDPDHTLLDGFKTLKVSLEKKAFMSHDDIRALVEKAQEYTTTELVIPVMVYTGISRADAVGTVLITEEAMQYRRKKTGKMITVPIHPELREYLGDRKGITRLTTIKHPDTLGHYFKLVAEEAGIYGISAHQVRHTFATLLLEAGADIAVVSELLGHTTVDITKRFYAHVLKGLKKKTIELLSFGAKG